MQTYNAIFTVANQNGDWRLISRNLLTCAEHELGLDAFAPDISEVVPARRCFDSLIAAEIDVKSIRAAYAFMPFFDWSKQADLND